MTAPARRRILHEIQLDKIAAVDRPCQEHARSVITKRAGAPGTTPEDQGDPMSSVIKKALGLADTATDDEIAAALAKKFEAGETAASELAFAKSLLALDAEERGHYDQLAKADKEKAKEFVEMDSKDRKKEVAKAREGDETLTVNGATISKREVGPNVFAMLKAQDEQIRSQAESFAKSEEIRKGAFFTKRATEELGHLAGTVEERTAVLKFLDGAPESVKKAADAIFTAAEAATKLAFKRAGHENPGNPGGDSAEAKLLAKRDEIRKREPALTAEQAYAKALDENPDLYDAAVNGEPARD